MYVKKRYNSQYKRTKELKIRGGTGQRGAEFDVVAPGGTCARYATGGYLFLFNLNVAQSCKLWLS